MLCVTADSPSYPRRHREMAERIAREFGLPHEFIETSEMDRPEYRANRQIAATTARPSSTNISRSWRRHAASRSIADGSNADDRGDYRPGRQAAREFGVKSPLDDADLTKDEIRELSRRAGLPTWDEPALACLSSRIPYQSEVTVGKLSMIEQAEDALRRHGFRVCRVRHHDTVARLEIGRDEMARALDPDISAALVRELKAIGYQYVSLDLQGYRTGSLNEILTLRPV